jgi:deazaflavin-dependent oxidoreductase (nitroreductase family)
MTNQLPPAQPGETAGAEPQSNYHLKCGCVMDIRAGGYPVLCQVHSSLPTFDEFKQALLGTASEQNQSIIERYNQRRAEEIREIYGSGPVENWSELPALGHVVLTTTGARTGRQRTVPLGSMRYGQDLIVEGSVAGKPTHPAWYHNIIADPSVVVETLGVRYPAVARIAEGAERAEIWQAFTELRPVLNELQALTTRVFPVVVLQRAGNPLD